MYITRNRRFNVKGDSTESGSMNKRRLIKRNSGEYSSSGNKFLNERKTENGEKIEIGGSGKRIETNSSYS